MVFHSGAEGVLENLSQNVFKVNRDVSSRQAVVFNDPHHNNKK